MKVEKKNTEKLKKYIKENRHKIDVYFKQIEQNNSGLCHKAQADKDLEARKLR